MKIQGRETHVLIFFKTVFGPLFPKCRTGIGKLILETLLIAMFEKLCGMTDKSHIQLDQFLKYEITEHLQSLEKCQSLKYFSAINDNISPS